MLLIEPDPDYRNRLREALARELPTATVDCVGDAGAFGALKSFAGLDVVVTCWRLYWTNARTVVRLVKAEAPQCRIVVMSDPMPFVLDPAEIVRSAGADRYVAKSASLDDVSGVVRALLS